MLLNTSDRYGIITILIHWLMATVIIGLFILGLWMVELDYYHRWYKAAPDLHKSIGILLFILLLFRFALRLLNKVPAPVPGIKLWEHHAAVVVHWLFYLIIFCTAMAGYLISTADGRSISIFGWFSIPATVTSIENQEDIAGVVHYYLAITLISLAVLHALAALKHHFYDKDGTLLRMLGLKSG